MKKNLIQKEYKKKIKLFSFYNQKYYNENISEISDSEYDQLKKDLIALEEKYKFLKSKISPLNSVGFIPPTY